MGAYFALWEVLERVYLVHAFAELRVMHVVRGASAAFLLGTWSFLQIRSSRLSVERDLDAQMRELGRRVTERTRELEEAHSFTEMLFDSLRERIVVHDRNGNAVIANRVATEAASCSASPSRQKVESEDRVDPHGRVWETERLTMPGGDGLVIEVGRDVTEQRNLEAQVRHQEKMASLGVLAAGFAHDLGNPLASLSTELELLEDESDVQRMRESLGVLRRHVSRMNRTLREMVDFARRRRDEVTDVSIGLAIADSVRLVRHDPRWKRVELVNDVPTALPAVRMVEDHLVLVLVNLMLNAVDAMPEGGTLVLSARERDGYVKLRVKDSGEGMTPEVRAKALTPLFTTKGHGRGTGLGLSVSNSIVKSIGGALRIDSTLGEGTEVSIDLPCASDRTSGDAHG